MAVQLNTDLPASWKIPGVYIKIDFQGSGAALDDDSKRVLIMGYRLSTGSAAPDTPLPFNNQTDVDAAFGRGSDAARAFAAFQSQLGAGLAEPWVLGTAEPSGGTAATHVATFAGTATASGSIQTWIAGYPAAIGVNVGDTAAVVSAALKAELDLLVDLPCTFGDSSGTITATMRHKGISTNDLPIMFNQTGATGITISPGIVTLTTFTGSGSHSLVVGATTITSTVSVDVATSVAALNAAINAGNYPVTSTASSPVVTLYYRNMRPVRRITATATGITTTVTLTGTTGAGVPTMTTAITAIEALKKGFSAIVSPWTDATTLDAIYDSVVVMENGINQKSPTVHMCSPSALTTAAAIVTAPAPDLTASPRFMLGWCKETPQQAYEIAARDAAIYVESDYPAENLAGKVLKSRGGVPLMNPALADVPSDADMNSAIRSYFMTPIAANSRDELTIIRPTTTSNASNQDMHEWSIIRQVDRFRVDLRQRLTDLFTGKVMRSSTPKTPRAVTTGSVKDAIYVFCLEKDDQDLFDDAPAFKDAIKVEISATLGRMDIFVPEAVIRPFYQPSVSLGPQ